MLNSVNNNSNGTAFKANLRVSVPADFARVKNIQRIFSQKTSEIKDTLNLVNWGNEECGEEFYYLGQNMGAAVVGSLKNSLAVMMKNLSDNEIATKLAKVVSALKAVSQWERSSVESDSEIIRFEQEHKRNLKISDIFKSKGNNIMAGRFKTLAGIYGKKLEEFNQRQANVDNYFLRQIKTIANGDEEIMDFQNLMY